MPDTLPLKSADQPRGDKSNKYDRESIPALAGLNLDASDGNLGRNEFTVVKNLRMHTQAELEIRSGYGAYDNASIGGGGATILCKAEFRNGQNKFFDITIFEDLNGFIKISAIARSPIVTSTPFLHENIASTLQGGSGDLVLVTPTAFAAKGMTGVPIACAVQYLSYLVVSVYGVGTYAVYPNDATCNTWSALLLGKQVCPTPWRLQYEQVHADDLVVYQFDDPSKWYNFQPSTNNVITKKTSTKPPFIYDRVPIKVPYHLARNHEFDLVKIKQWIWNDNDPKNSFNQPQADGHLATNGWGYRAIAVLKRLDPKGGTITVRSSASVDWWVPDNIYVPPVPYDTTALSMVKQLNQVAMFSAFFILDKTGTPASFDYPDAVPNGNTVQALPNEDTMIAFDKAILDYESKTATIGASNTGEFNPKTPFLIPSLFYAGFRLFYSASQRTNISFVNVSTQSFSPPYWTEVPASFIAEAPLTTLSWTDFSTTDGTTTNPLFPADAIEIEIYRTAFNESTEVMTDNTPLFGPHLYGYVGSVTESGDFTDNIKDSAINFGKRPDDYDNYLEGEFSGQVIRAYNRKLVLGNTSQDYKVLPPAAKISQSFIFDGTDIGAPTGGLPYPNITPSDIVTNIAADGDTIDQFYISYLDGDNNESDLAPVKTTIPFGHGATPPISPAIAFLLPRGYAPTVVKVRLYRSHFAAGTRTYAAIADIDASKGYYISIGNETPISTSGFRPTHTVKNTKEQGAVIWSNVYSVFDWPPINFELVSADSPITALEAIMGPLWVWTDKSVDLSTISIVFPRGEEETKWIGAIGRFAICKVNKIVFFLSAQGLMFMESSGPVPFPGNIHSEIFKYLSESIPNVPPLTNAKRASMGYLPHRGELWLYLPSSADLGGSLPARLFIYKFFDDNLAKFVNYEFDLTEAGNPTGPIFFQTQADGQMFCSYPVNTMSLNAIRTLDTDTPAVWAGDTAIEKSWSAGEINQLKLMRQFEVTMDFNCSMIFYTGARNATGAYDPVKGYINVAANGYTNLLTPPGAEVKAVHVIGGDPVETTSYAPITRIVTTPTGGGLHDVHYKGMVLWYKIIHNAPLS